MNSPGFKWPNGCRCAVSLTYDDGLPGHHEHVGPVLEEHGLRGTFSPIITWDIMENPEKWRALAERGHELGNHTVFHPCRQLPETKKPHPLWQTYNLCEYGPTRFKQELQVANLVLHLLDGKKERTYSNTCCNTTIGLGKREMPMDSILTELFVAARGPHNNQVAAITPEINLMQVGHRCCDGHTRDQLVQEMEEETVLVEGWALYMTHGVGAWAHNRHIDVQEHVAWITWLGENRKEVWTAPFVEVARHVKNWLAEQANAE